MRYLTTLRVSRMEKYFNEVSAAFEKHNIKSKRIQRKIRLLEKYQTSGLWLKDYECDERGELPKDLKRGVLSEDGLYNLLCDIKNQQR